MKEIQLIYKELIKLYGPQGWWPLVSHIGTNPTKTGSIQGYHPKNYDLPKTSDEVFEVCCGAVLTQNVGWINVEKALLNLQKLKAINSKRLLKLDDEILKEAIKPAGYFNQKAKKLKALADFFLHLQGRIPNRQELLDIWGIGPETADSMLLYAFKVPSFVVDAYTRRIFANLGYINEKADYEHIKALFEQNLTPDLITYQEYHALIVEHAKRFYAKKGQYDGCPLLNKFRNKNDN